MELFLIILRYLNNSDYYHSGYDLKCKVLSFSSLEEATSFLKSKISSKIQEDEVDQIDQELKHLKSNYVSLELLLHNKEYIMLMKDKQNYEKMIKEVNETYSLLQLLEAYCDCVEHKAWETTIKKISNESGTWKEIEEKKWMSKN